MKKLLPIFIFLLSNTFALSAQNKLFLSNVSENKIQAVDILNQTIEDLVTGIDSIGNLAVSTTEDELFWCNLGGTIFNADLEGNNVSLIVSGTGSLGDILVDEENKLLYWSEFWGGRIMKSDFDGNNKVVFLSGFGIPGHLAIDYSGGFIYWSAISSNSIKRTSFDGQNTETVLTGYDLINGLFFDEVGRKLYWTDWSSHALYRADDDGANITTIITGIGSPLDVYVDNINETIYWIDNLPLSNPVRKCDLNGENEVDVLSFDGYMVFAGLAGYFTTPNLIDYNYPSSDVLVTFFPNPAKDAITLAWDEKDITEKSLTFILYSVDGKLMMIENVNNNESVNLQAIGSGLYYFTLENQGTILLSSRVAIE